ncbi:FecR family protein [Algoriphagus aquimarinus]|uniref:Ferric-dicitrate binding protein FerR, regulates iron transport through sigma-19 n=1 Tax=Algoriphagus aquimarinus TaxID=237018 RepID=A0A1I0YCW7_9BACT|nr:FecR domain-containing protein [Algoriphagus aquimarinus]SFB10626.1 ferric-dicitrate binding protein FerR, regulates iron transport through sigma-19 [Algoriphagus aquimarinus]
MRPSRQEIKDLVNRYLEDKITKADFDSFLNGLDDPEVREIYSEALKSSFENSLNENSAYILTSKKQTFSHQLGKYWMGVAATLLLLASFSFLIFNYLQNTDTQSFTLYQTVFAEQKNISLPDGTEVNLNVASSLEQMPFENQEMRKVNLRGEAFFQVAKDKSHPFEITTQAVKVMVLGTAFNISSYEEDEMIEVSVTEGTVNVSLAWENLVIDETLTIGQRIQIDKHAKTYRVVEFNEPIHWKSQVLNFNQTDFEQVINTLERWYGLELDVKDSSLYELKLTGQFKDKSINEVISAIGFLANREADSNELITVISKKSKPSEN